MQVPICIPLRYHLHLNVVIMIFLLAASLGSGLATAQTSTISRGTVSCASSTPDSARWPLGSRPGMGQHMNSIESDQLYIDMLLALDRSVVALSQVALPELTDSRLQVIAEDLVVAKAAEQKELREYRQEFYGSSESSQLDQQMTQLMMGIMPHMGQSITMMSGMMDPESQVIQYCAATNPDLAFIDQVLGLYQMTRFASEFMLTRSVHPEIRDFAMQVLADVETEIDKILVVQDDLLGKATPAAKDVGAALNGPSRI